MIPITTVKIGQEEEDLVLEVLRSGMLAHGPMVERFEDHCRQMAGAEHAVAVNNGTTALVLALEVLDLKPGDEVITSPFTFVATLNAILEAGATARFADIDLDSFNLDPGTLEARCSPSTRVVMPVHLYGQAADMAAIGAFATPRGLAIVEDAAQAHGATFDGVPVGAAGLATFSFYATKNLYCGEGGVVTTDDATLADRMRVLRNQGMRQRYEYEVAGHNYRLTSLAAAVAVPQFARMADVVAARRANAAVLNEGLSGIEGLVVPATLPGRGHVWHQYTVRLTDAARIDRDTFAKGLTELGIGNGFYYPRPVYDYDCYRSHPRVIIDHCPNADLASRQVVSLPVHQHLTPAELDQIVAAVRSLLA